MPLLLFSFLMANCTASYIVSVVSSRSPQVKVVELKVTWITKSYSPKGSDSVYPPASTITQEHLCWSV